MTDSDFGKPIIAIANSYTQFVPGHVHLKNVGEIVAEQIAEAGGVAREFHTIAVDDGIAMGHAGMLYSLPSREIIADSVEYMVNAHTADALVCISNCDKITPGMLNAAMRLNIPTVFVSGGPMESGFSVVVDGVVRAGSDLITAISASANSAIDDENLDAIERSACPTCGSCSGMFTANSMNCLTEALGLSLPGNGSTLATHSARRELFAEAGRLIVDLCTRYYRDDDDSVLPRSVATKSAFNNAMALDVAMGGSTNTVLHILAAVIEAGVFGVSVLGAQAHPGRRPGGRGRLRSPRHRGDLPPRPVPGEGRPQLRLLHGARPPRRRHPGDPRRALPRRAPGHGCPLGAFAEPRAVHRRLGHP